MWILNKKVKVILEVAICSTIQVLVLSSTVVVKKKFPYRY